MKKLFLLIRWDSCSPCCSSVRDGVTHCGFRVKLPVIFSCRVVFQLLLSFRLLHLLLGADVAVCYLICSSRTEGHRQTQSGRKSPQRQGACDDTCRSPDVTGVKTIFLPFTTLCSTKTSLSHRQEVTWVKKQHTHHLTKSLKQGHGGEVTENAEHRGLRYAG